MIPWHNDAQPEAHTDDRAVQRRLHAWISAVGRIGGNCRERGHVAVRGVTAEGV